MKKLKIEGNFLQKHNQAFIEQYNDVGAISLGPVSSWAWKNDFKHLFFPQPDINFVRKC